MRANRVIRALALGAVLLASTSAHAEAHVTLRFAAVAPDGTSWARELRAFAREAEIATAGRVSVKWYLGAVAGDEIQALERMNRGQLDGGAGASYCEHIAPSLKVTRILGLLRTPREMRHVLTRLRPTIETEFEAAGHVNLGLSPFGRVLLFSRAPIRSMAELRQQRLWIWSADEIGARMLTQMGVPVVRLSPSEAGQAYEDKQHDGFVSIALGALAFQWSTRARHYSDLTVAVLPSCLTITRRAFNAISNADREQLRAAAAKLTARIDDQERSQEMPLIETLFPKQGLTLNPASTSFRNEFLEAARNARATLDEQQVPHELMSRVLSWLGDLRGN
jgi:TRAP-type transport system periplasmic protein